MRGLKGSTLMVVASVLVVAAPATAAGPTKTTTVGNGNRVVDPSDPHPCWPGWGYGDENHEHCGPPGLVDNPSGRSFLAPSSGGSQAKVQGKAQSKLQSRTQAQRRSGL